MHGFFFCLEGYFTKVRTCIDRAPDTLSYACACSSHVCFSRPFQMMQKHVPRGYTGPLTPELGYEKTCPCIFSPHDLYFQPAKNWKTCSGGYTVLRTPNSVILNPCKMRIRHRFTYPVFPKPETHSGVYIPKTSVKPSQTFSAPGSIEM